MTHNHGDDFRNPDPSSSSHSSSDFSSVGSALDFGDGFPLFEFGGRQNSPNAFTPGLPEWHTRAMSWAFTAGQLGFTLHVPLGRCDPNAPFGAFKRLLGPYEAHGGPAWLYGNVRGAEVVIAPFGMFQPPWAGAILRIDPALHLGLFASADDSPQGWGARTFEPERSASLLDRPAEAGSLQQAIATSLVRGMVITDSTIVMGLRDGTDTGTIASMLEFGAWIAAGLVQRRLALAPTESERALDATWQSFAADRGLTFDRLRRHLHGAIDGYRLSLRLGSSATSTFTEIAVAWPHDLGFTAHASTGAVTTSYHALPQRPLSFGAPTSTLPFVLLGDDAALAGGFLTRGPVQAALVALAEVTHEITFHGTGANWVTGPLLHRAELERAVETALALARGIAGVAPLVTAPYR